MPHLPAPTRPLPRPLPRSLPRLLAHTTLPDAELSAARLDGEVFAVGAGWCPIDVLPGPAERAAGALAGCPPGWIAELESALWIWGALAAEPPVLRVCVPLDARSRDRRRSAGLSALREVVIDAAEIATVGGRRVTTPARTAVDLARHAADWDGIRAAVAVLTADRIDAAELAAGLPRDRHLAHARRARRRLAGLDSPPPPEVSRC